jgi:hypothetical protein
MPASLQSHNADRRDRFSLVFTEHLHEFWHIAVVGSLIGGKGAHRLGQ